MKKEKKLFYRKVKMRMNKKALKETQKIKKIMKKKRGIKPRKIFKEKHLQWIIIMLYWVLKMKNFLLLILI
jgi:hypothetical protein